MAEVPIKYSDGSFVNGDNLLDALKVSAPAVYESVKDKKFAVLKWYDDDRVGNSELLKNSSLGCLPWKLLGELYREGDLMHLQHCDLFTDDNSKRPRCQANDCQHIDEICPLCLYALGY
ncbi:hypothetical protein [uncultured Treponema sp.]|uniref:hypothetical protein n=1 Tax=uncultured Treponema sp. TaxID=162155 RepID=UPI0025EFA5EF|nr:hypothetical protein [uncultured Treponema sp.]